MADKKTTTINVYMDKPCTQCGVMGATDSGICLRCATKLIKTLGRMRPKAYTRNA